MGLLNKLRLYRHLLVAFILFGGYWLVEPLIDRRVLATIMNSIAGAVGLAVTIMYAPPAWRGLSSGERPDRGTQLIIGITLSFFVLFLWRGIFQVLRLQGTISDAFVQVFFPFTSYLVALAGTLHITAPGENDGHVSRRSWAIVAAAVGGGLLFGLYIVWNFGPI